MPRDRRAIDGVGVQQEHRESGNGRSNGREIVAHYVEAPHLGGVELWVANLASSAKMRDLRPVLILGRGYLLAKQQLQSYAERVERVGGVVVSGKGPGVSGLTRLVLDVLVLVPRYAIVAAVFNHSFSLRSMVAMCAIALLRKVPLRFVVVHMNYSDFKFGLRQRASIGVSRMLAKRLHFSFVGVSKKVLDFFEFVPATDREVISPGLNSSTLTSVLSTDSRRSGSLQERLTLFFVGRLDQNKNPALALAILRALRERGHGARLVMVGDGPARAELEAAVEEHGLRDHVEFLGFRRDVLELLWHQADIALHTSRSEALGLFPLEAQAVGVPVVAAEAVADEVVFWPEGVRRLSLDAPLGDWCDAVVSLAAKRSTDRHALLERFETSQFCNDEVATRYRHLLNRGA